MENKKIILIGLGLLLFSGVTLAADVGIRLDDAAGASALSIKDLNSSEVAKINSVGTIEVRGFKLSTGALNNYVLTSDPSGYGSWEQIPSGGTIGGSGTANYVSKFTSTGTIGSSSIYDNGTNIGIGTSSPTNGSLEVNSGTANINAIYGKSAYSNIMDPSAWVAGVKGESTATGASSTEIGVGVYGAATSGTGANKVAMFGITNYGTGVMGLASASGAGVNGESDSGPGVRGSSKTGYSGEFDGGKGVRVEGTIETYSAGGIKFPDGTLQTTAFSASSSSWTQNGNNIYNSNSGKVGIGTSTPTNGKLEVNSTNFMDGSGIYGATSVSDQKAVYGLASSLSGAGMGVYGESRAINGYGVYGRASSTEGVNIGVWGMSNSHDGIGVKGVAVASSGMNYAIYGQTNSPDGYSGYFTGGKVVVNNASLEVYNDFKILNSSPGIGKVLTSNADGLATWSTPSGNVGGSGTTNYIPLWSGSSTLSDSVIYQSSGNVGIGTASPGANLHVVNSTTGQAIIGISTGGGTGVTAQSTSGTGNGLLATSAGGYSVYALGPKNYFEGDVGIGTTSPSTKLDVNGNAKAIAFESTVSTGTAPLTVASTTKVNNLNADMLDSLHSTDFASASSLNNYVLKGGDTMTGALNLPSNGLVVGTSELVVSSGNVGIGMASIPAFRTYIRGTGTNETTYSLVVVNADATVGLSVRDDSRVGIGIQDPTEKLEVQGNVKADNFIGNGSSLTNVTGTDNTKVLKAGDTMSGTLNLPANGLVVGTNQLVVNSGNVGIGTANPGAKLDVNTFTGGAAAIGDHATAHGDRSIAMGSSVSAEATNSIVIGSGNGLDPLINNTQNSLMVGFLHSYPTLYVDEDNVGIGTSEPDVNNKLEVAGKVQMGGFKLTAGPSAGYVLTSDGSGNGTWQAAAGNVSGSGTTNYISKFTGSTSLGDSLLFDNGTGISISTPEINATVTVNGDVSLHEVSDRSTRNDGYGKLYANNDQKLRYKDSTGQEYVLSNYGLPTRVAFWKTGGEIGSNSNFFWDDTNSRLGIGTTGPLSKLDVNGGVAIGSYAGFNSAPTNGMIVSGNVGIGTTNPAASLEVGTNHTLYVNAGTGKVGIGTSSPSNGKLEVNASTGNAVYATTNDSGGNAAGVYGLANNSTGPNYGVRGDNAANNGYGVYGYASNSSTASAKGVFGRSDGETGYGVYGYANHGSGMNYGIYGETVSDNGYSGYFNGGKGVFISATLEVGQQIKINGGSPGSGKVLTSDGSGLATWQTPTGGIDGSGTDNYLPRWNGTNSLETSSVYQDDSGNVGIGTSSPGYKLSVVGDIGSNLVDVNNSNAGGTGINVNVAGTGIYLQTTGSYGITVSNAASAGINSNGTTAGVLGSGGTYGMWGSSSSGTGVYGSTSSGNYGVWGTGGSYGVYGTGTTAGVWGNGNVGVYGTGSGPTSTGVYGNGSSWGGYFLGKGYFSDNVGIGTPEPQAKLHISEGNLLIQNHTGSISNIRLSDNTDPSNTANCNYWDISRNASNRLTFIYNDGVQAYDPYLTINTIGNVGIGTATMNPLSKLDVFGGVAIGSYAGTNAAPTNGMIVSGNVGIGTTNPQAALNIASSEGMAIMYLDAYQSGYPVIGGRKANGTPASPTAAQLDDILFAFGGRGYYGSTGYSSTNKAAIQMKAAENWSDSSHLGTYLSFFTTLAGSSTTSEKMRITDSGNVGIGTTNPTNGILEVRGLTGKTIYATVNTPTSDANSYAVCGTNESAASNTWGGLGSRLYGVYGANTSGANTKGYLGGYAYGAYGANSTDTVYGYLGSSNNGVFGASVAGGYGVYGYNSSTGWAGYFDGGKGLYTTSLEVYNMASTSGTTVVVDSNGFFYKTTSSRRYKENILDLKTDFSKILEVQPKSFNYKSTGAGDIGYIAEDIDALGLKDLVIYDKDGRPESLKYDRFSLYLTEVVKDQKKTINEQQKALDELKTKNDQLETRLKAVEAKMGIN